LFFDSMVAWSFFLYGRERVKKISRSAAHLMTALLRNSLPLSKSSPVTSNGTSSTPAFNADRMWTWALLRTLRVKAHPVWTSVRFNVRANSPFNVGPQCATVSPSKNPGSASTSSPALRILIEDRSNGEGFVVETPRIWSVALAGLRYRSIEAELIASNSLRTAGLYRSTPSTSSP